MRITNSMVNDRVVFNMQRSLTRFSNLQTSMSSGRRINKPSDDPMGTLRDLNYRTELARITQYRKNISQGKSWMDTYDAGLSDAKNFVSTAKELAVSMSNGHYDAAARSASAQEVQSLIDQMVQIGNKELQGRRIFGGFKTQVTPFDQGGNGVVYKGDQGQIQFEIESSLLVTINFDGQSTFLTPLTILGEKADLNVGVTASTLLANMNGGSGVSLGTFTVTDKNNDTLPVSTIDLSTATTLGDAITAINAQLATDGLTNITARIGDEGNNITLDTTQDGKISNSTALSVLNDSNGVDMSTGKIRVTNNSGISVEIDLSSATSISDVISSFNTQLNAQLSGLGYAAVNMSINAAGTGLQIDDTNIPPIGLSVEDLSLSSTTAESLGIVGSFTTTLSGGALNPATSFDIEEVGIGSTAGDLGISGLFSRTKVGNDIDPALTVNDKISDLKNRLGLSNDSLTIYHGTSRATIDLSDPSLVTVQDLIDAFSNTGLLITASINTDGTGLQIVNDDPTRSLAIEDSTSGEASKELGIFGGADIFGTMVILRNALLKNDQKGTGLILENLDSGILQLLNVRSNIGARAMRLESTESRMVDMQLSFTRLLSEEEDADLAELVTQLTTYENNFRASMISASKIIQSSLLDFLR